MPDSASGKSTSATPDRGTAAYGRGKKACPARRFIKRTDDLSVVESLGGRWAPLGECLKLGLSSPSATACSPQAQDRYNDDDDFQRRRAFVRRTGPSQRVVEPHGRTPRAAEHYQCDKLLARFVVNEPDPAANCAEKSLSRRRTLARRGRKVAKYSRGYAPRLVRPASSASPALLRGFETAKAEKRLSFSVSSYYKQSIGQTRPRLAEGGPRFRARPTWPAQQKEQLV